MPSRSAARCAARAVLVLMLALSATVGLAGTASAHASLIGSDPAEGAVLPVAPTVVTLTFDDALAEFEPTVIVTGPDGVQYQSGPATVDGVRLSNAVAPLTVAGAYTIAYRVVSDDGHPVEGEIRFELAPAAVPSSAAPLSTTPASPTHSSTPASTAPTSASAVPTVAAAADNTASSSSGGWSAWQWAMVGLFVVLAFLGTLVARRRMESSARAGSGGPDGTGG